MPLYTEKLVHIHAVSLSAHACRAHVRMHAASLHAHACTSSPYTFMQCVHVHMPARMAQTGTLTNTMVVGAAQVPLVARVGALTKEMAAGH